MTCRILLFATLSVGVISLASGCDTADPDLTPDLFEGTWINENPNLDDVARICRIDIIMYAGDYRVRRWNPGEHTQLIRTEFPSSNMFSVEWNYYSISTESLTLNLLSINRLEAVRVLDFEEERFEDRTYVEYFVRQ